MLFLLHLRNFDLKRGKPGPQAHSVVPGPNMPEEAFLLLLHAEGPMPVLREVALSCGKSAVLLRNAIPVVSIPVIVRAA